MKELRVWHVIKHVNTCLAATARLTVAHTVVLTCKFLLDRALGFLFSLFDAFAILRIEWYQRGPLLNLLEFFYESFIEIR